MAGLLDRLDLSTSTPWVVRARIAAGEVVERLERGEGAAILVEELGITVAELLASVAWAGLGPEGSGGPCLTRCSPARPKLVAAVDARALSPLFPGAERSRVLAVAAGVYQILDAWDLSHTAAQEADELGERASAAYWHGIAHRREPDAWNAAYWFRRVGRHALFPDLAALARATLAERGEASVAERLLPGGDWDSSAFIDLCTSAIERSKEEAIGRWLQRAEMSLLLEHSVRQAGAD